MTRVTFWGLSDADSWLNRGRMNYPLLWDRQRQPKPAFHAVVEVLRHAPDERMRWRDRHSPARARGASRRSSSQRRSPDVTAADRRAPPPASSLSLWYRAPASDHPLLPLERSREARQAATAEWVRALPVGNGRLGAMVFGGIVARAAAAERGHAVGGPAVRSGESRREGRAARSAAPARGAQVRGGRRARRSEGDVEAARRRCRTRRSAIWR